MSKFLEKPFLPSSKVKTVICGYESADFINYTKYLGIEAYFTKKNKCYDKRVETHADLSVFHLGNNNIILHNQLELSETLSSFGMDVINESCKGMLTYPDDCSLNLFKLGQTVFGKFSSASQHVLSYCKANNIDFIDVKQGYAKCSTILLDEHSFITDDQSIYNKGIDLGLECLLVSKGDVKLDGFDYGFIGGCAFKIDLDRLAFFGDVTKHRDYDRILHLTSCRGIKIEYLKDHDLYDVGSVIPLIEE